MPRDKSDRRKYERTYVKGFTDKSITFHNPYRWSSFGEPHKTEINRDVSELVKFLGKAVVVDYKKVRQHKQYGHVPDDWDGKPFISTVVSINRLNSSQNGHGNNKGELEIFPDQCGNWHSVDLRMVRLAEESDFAEAQYQYDRMIKGFKKEDQDAV